MSLFGLGKPKIPPAPPIVPPPPIPEAIPLPGAEDAAGKAIKYRKRRKGAMGRRDTILGGSAGQGGLGTTTLLGG